MTIKTKFEFLDSDNESDSWWKQSSRVSTRWTLENMNQLKRLKVY